MVNFAGFSMPVQYGTHGISASHLHTRSKSSVFDVSHMLQTVVRGKDKDAWLESICVADVQGKENDLVALIFRLFFSLYDDGVDV